MSLSRNIGSYCPKPIAPSQAPTSTPAAPPDRGSLPAWAVYSSRGDIDTTEGLLATAAEDALVPLDPEPDWGDWLLIDEPPTVTTERADAPPRYPRPEPR